MYSFQKYPINANPHHQTGHTPSFKVSANIWRKMSVRDAISELL